MQVLDGQFTKPPMDPFWTKAYTRLYCTKTRRVKSPEPSLVLVQVSGRKKPAVRNSSIALIRIPKLRKDAAIGMGLSRSGPKQLGAGCPWVRRPDLTPSFFYSTIQTDTDRYDR